MRIHVSEDEPKLVPRGQLEAVRGVCQEDERREGPAPMFGAGREGS